MVSARFYLLLVLLMLIMPAYTINYAGTLTGNECRAYFASEDVNKQIHAYFNCPKKLRPKPKKRIIRLEKSSEVEDDDDYYNNLNK